MPIFDFLFRPKQDAIELRDIHLSESNRSQLNQLLKEFKHVHVLKKYGLPVDNKILLFGHTGCGKTTTAVAIAKELDKRILILNLGGGVIDSKLGQSAKNISEVFQKAAREKAVLFLDEFDYIGKAREIESNDNSEMDRLVNTVIQHIDRLPEDTLLIAATNHSKAIDSAILRRFQLKLEFEKPTKELLDKYYDSLISKFPAEFCTFNRKYDVSYAEAKDFAYKAIKNNIIRAEERG